MNFVFSLLEHQITGYKNGKKKLKALNKLSGYGYQYGISQTTKDSIVQLIVSVSEGLTDKVLFFGLYVTMKWYQKYSQI